VTARSNPIKICPVAGASEAFFTRGTSRSLQSNHEQKVESDRMRGASTQSRPRSARRYKPAQASTAPETRRFGTELTLSVGRVVAGVVCVSTPFSADRIPRAVKQWLSPDLGRVNGVERNRRNGAAEGGSGRFSAAPPS
jgi:hypothetical protein